MQRGSKILILIVLINSIFAFHAIGGNSLRGLITDIESKEQIAGSIITITEASGKKSLTLSDASGKYSFTNIENGKCRISVAFLGYKTQNRQIAINGDTECNFALVADSKVLDDVVVTASESKGITSSSRINREAMEHLQPSSFTDLLALLPGGKTKLPDLTNANTIKLREVGSSSKNYDISSLGTIFITDGIPISSNANMQQVKQASSSTYGDADAGRNYTNQGVDMRTISTDEIENVEIIRGIAPVEYGDLTSGVVIINRKMRETPWEARFKADPYSKLLYLGKGFAVRPKNFILNAGLDYLDAKADPRNSLTNYKRMTGSLRMQKIWQFSNDTRLRWKTTADYTGSFDNDKADPEILKQKDDSYKSSYNRMSLSQQFALNFQSSKWMRSLQLDIAASYEPSSIKQQKQISLQRDQAASVTLEEGEHDGIYLPYNYISNVLVDGKPLNAYAKLKWQFSIPSSIVSQNFNIGAEWKLDKNYGEGQVYDPSRPIQPGTPYRPRRYSDIPGQQQLAFYLQDDASAATAVGTFNLSAGLRSMQLLNLSARYAMHGTVYLDPRANAQWVFPAIDVDGKDLVFDLSGGFGRQTKFPTLLQIYPDKVYTDIVEMNYYNMNPDHRRLYLRTYIDDPVNYNLKPARNNKWEVRFGASYDNHNLSVTYFREITNSGFRYSSTVRPYTYKDYDESAINGSQLTGRPELSDVPYAENTILGMTTSISNGSRVKKEGVEFQYSSKRFDAIKTRFTVNGAWFRSTYTNSQPMYKTVTSTVVGNDAVNEKYIGYYATDDGNIRQQFNTNFMADTYIKKLGLTFSLTAECTWFESTQSMAESGVPLAYMDVTGNVYPFTAEDATDAYKQWLIVNYTSTAFDKRTTPFYAYFNLKVTKNFGRWMTLALFVDRILDYMPDYTNKTGITVRRMARPYFGMELNFKL